MFSMIETGKLKPELMIGRTLSLDEAPEALMAMDRFDGVGIGVITRF
jgi:alcohol dehydrogenase